MRKPASDVAGIEEVNTKQDKITYTPADDSKVVHSADMRKPASDVAGIEEVNVKQDKIGYTPADDSKVVHDNHDGSVQVNGVSILPLNGIQDASQPYGLDLDKYKDTGNYRFDAVNTIHHPATFSPQYIQLIVFGNHGIDSNGKPGSCFQIAIQDHSVAVRNMYTPTTYNTWRIVSDDSKVVHSKDMRKPASDVAGIEEVNTKQDKIGYTPADDSKVVHDNHDGRISVNGASILPANEDIIGRLDGTRTNMNDIPMGWFYINGWANVSGLSNWGLPSDLYYVHCFKTEYAAPTIIQIAYGAVNNTYMRTMSDTHWTTWKLLADDSKVVHSTDMRKPANDVAGIEEVNAKQDKISYAPADDSKVWHSTVTQLNSTDMNTVLTAGFYQLISGTNGMPSGDAWTIYQVISLSPGSESTNGVQLAYGTNSTVLGMRSWDTWGGGVHFSDWTKFADDSKVAHLSGANNFDTVPMVNNNPLLLASSLPSDLARTGSNQEFTGKNTFDTAPIDKTTGNPYITKSDLSNGLSTKVTDNKDGLSTKVTDNKDNTITANNVKYDLSKTGLTPIGFVNSGSFNDLPLGTVMTAPPITDGPDTVHAFTTTTFYSSQWGGRKAQIAIADRVNLMYFRVYGISWNSWTLLSDDSKVVHSTDMRKPASDVAGIEEVNAKQDKIGYTPADDSKVAHLSGANNFDTVPTVNNNPLLLESSLPSDLARTGSNQEYTGKNTFDIAPIDKTTGNPYITKDGVPKVDPAVIFKRLLTADDDILALGPGTYYTWVAVPKNYPTGITSCSTIVVRDKGNHQMDGRSIMLNDWAGHQLLNIHYGSNSSVDSSNLWLGWQVPNADTMASQSGANTFTGKNTFDTAPIDKTTGHPYITKDSIPAISPTLADTTKDANFTGKLQKSGIDVATTTDVTKAVNTATSNSSKYIKASNNDENSAISDSTSGNSDDIYYWCEN